MTITSPLPPDAQRTAGEALQATLVDLVDLSLVAKQAHWNVVGRNFRSVHLQLDEVVKMLDGAPHVLPDFAGALRVQELVEGILAPD